MIPSDAHLLAFLAVIGVLKFLFLYLLWRELVGGRADQRAARDRELRVLERLAPPRPSERRRMGFAPGDGDGRPRGRDTGPELIVYYPEEGEDVERTVREAAES